MAEPGKLPPEVVEALKRGDKLGALKMMLPNAKHGGIVQRTILEALQRAAESGSANVKITSTSKLPPDVVMALKNGNKIEAIKLLRRHTGAGLTEAKNHIEAVGLHHLPDAGSDTPAEDTSMDHMPAPSRKPAGIARPKPSAPPYVRRAGLSPGEVPRSNNALQVVVVFVAIAVVIGLYLFLA